MAQTTQTNLQYAFVDLLAAKTVETLGSMPLLRATGGLAVVEDFSAGKTKTNPIIVDVGGNIGVTTQYFREHAAKVYTIEPSSENFEALKANKENNKWDNVEIFKIAISNENGKATINRNKNNHTMNSITNVYNDQVKGESEEVETKTFMTFFKENNITLCC